MCAGILSTIRLDREWLVDIIDSTTNGDICLDSTCIPTARTQGNIW